MLRVREHKYIWVLQAYCVHIYIYIYILIFNIHVYNIPVNPYSLPV